MAAPIGNQFWKLRSKHGRDRLFATPELMWEAACEYFQWCDENPLEQPEQRKGAVIIPKGFEGDITDLVNPIIAIPRPRPYTLQGLCLYLNANTGYWKDFRAAIASGEGLESIGFSTIIKCIEDTIYHQKFSGASSGLFNANIIARDLGLRDNSDVTTGGEQITFNISMKI